jgi:hypothetical protein
VSTDDPWPLTDSSSKIALLLSTAGELVGSDCNFGQKMSVNYALQFVDMIQKLSAV